MVRRKLDPPRGLLRTTGPAPRRYRHVRYHPSADLEPYVEHYWTVQWDLRGQPPERGEVLPHPSMQLIFEGGGKSRVKGVTTAKFTRILEGKGEVFSVKFTPAGFHPFAGVPVSRYSETAVGLHEVFGTDSDGLEASILSESDDLSRIEIIEHFLRPRRPEPDPMVTRVSAIVYEVARERGILRVQDLVERHGMSARTLQRVFAKYVGVSPKWVIQRYRLHEAAVQLAAAGPVNQASLALDLGYSDQAHFVRDFRSIVGMSPAAYARAARRE